MFVTFTKGMLAAVVMAFVGLAVPAHAQDSMKFLAPGFTTRPASSKLLVLPADIELYSISLGGVREPKAGWTALAAANLGAALAARSDLLGLNVLLFDPKALDDWDGLAELGALHGAVAQAVFVHHAAGAPVLPTKQGRLDWSLGDAVQPLQARTGADYALFTWIRDTYASPERKAAMVAVAMMGVVMTGGRQLGYASLVDLHTGRIVWFNELRRSGGDLREPATAPETVDALLKGFPGAR